MSKSENPPFPRRALGESFRRLREQRGWSMAFAAAQMGFSPQKLSSIETSNTKVDTATVHGMCAIYETTAAHARELVSLCEATSEKRWVEEHQGVADYARKFVHMEQTATSMNIFETEFVTGLAQTDAYLSAALDRDHLYRPVRERVIAGRRQRREEFEALANPPLLRVILRETAIRTQVGGPEVMAEQLRHLKEVAQRPGVEIRVLPFAAGAHPSMTGAYTVMDFADQPSVVYMEQRDACRYEDAAATVALYRADFEATWALTIPLEEIEIP